jgi:hypothetical protein
MIVSRSLPVKQTSIRTAAYSAFDALVTSHFQAIHRRGEPIFGH